MICDVLEKSVHIESRTEACSKERSHSPEERMR